MISLVCWIVATIFFVAVLVDLFLKSAFDDKLAHQLIAAAWVLTAIGWIARLGFGL